MSRFYRSGLFVKLLLIASLTSLIHAIDISPESLRITEKKIQEIARKNLPATISLIPAARQGGYGTGSGVIVSEDGLILTAAHVTMSMKDSVIVIFPDGKRARGKVLGMDFTRDAGMVQILDGGKYPHVDLGTSDGLTDNQWCIALGHAGGFQPDRSPPLRLGRVILNNRDRFIMTDSALIAGDSGGPLFDLEGRLIGIHSNIGESLLQNNHVPISVFKRNWDRLKSGHRFGGDVAGALLSNPDRPMIGAVLHDAPGESGALVKDLAPKSPAARAGLQVGDKITKVAGKPVRNSQSLVGEIRKKRPGDLMEIVVLSDGKTKNLTIKVASARHLNGGKTPPPPLNDLPPKRTAEERKDLQATFNRKMRDSLEEGFLKLTERDFEMFHDPKDFRQFMSRFEATLSREEKQKLAKIIDPPKPEPISPTSFDPDKPLQVSEDFFRAVLNAFRPSAQNASDATHLVFRGQDWKSLCTVIHPDGYALTKASEISTKNNQALTVLVAKGKSIPARVIRTYDDHDLALIKMDAQSRFAYVSIDQSAPPSLGSVLTAPGPGPDPLAIGLVSVPPRSLSGGNKGFLGIGTAPAKEGVRVSMVLDDGSAGKAGIIKGDIITRIDKAVCDTPEELIKQISSRRPGSDVIIQLLRKGRPMSVKVELGDRKKLDEGIPDRGGKMNEMGTEVSQNRSGFPNVIQTDLPIDPNQCGGPVVDLDGNVIGINIARAGRIKTYTIPASEIAKLVSSDVPSPKVTASTQSGSL